MSSVAGGLAVLLCVCK